MITKKRNNRRARMSNSRTIRFLEFIMVAFYIVLGLSEFAECNYAFACIIMFLAGGMLMLFIFRPCQTGNKKIRKQIKIKYFDDELLRLEKLSVGCWIDLRAAKTVELRTGQRELIPLGVAMQLPEGYEAIVAPRSSTCKHFKTMQTNGIGIIDTSYCGDNDQWHFPALALEDTVINKNDRICQFRIQEVQPKIEFEEVACLRGKDRGGFGSTGAR